MLTVGGGGGGGIGRVAEDVEGESEEACRFGFGRTAGGGGGGTRLLKSFSAEGGGGWLGCRVESCFFSESISSCKAMISFSFLVKLSTA
jgi:hypothetical protein